MHIGLLEAETLPPKVVAEFGSYGGMFEQLITPHKPGWTFQRFAVDQGELPPTPTTCDAYIITGARHNAYDEDPWIEKLKSFIREIHHNKQTCLGICFGHQVIAQALGGKVEKSTKGWGVGVADFALCQTPPWLSEKQDSFSILVSHQDQVVEAPSISEIVARSDFCPIGGLNIENHIFTLQGHPEFKPAYLSRLISKRTDIIGHKKANNSLKLLENFNQDDFVTRMLIEFLQQAA